jgi:hypothetical protein
LRTAALLRHVWRGVIDGDDSIGRDQRVKDPLGGWTIKLTGCQAIVDAFNDYAAGIIGDGRRRKDVGNGINPTNRQLILTGLAALRVMDHLYADSVVALPRKQQLADSARMAYRQRLAAGRTIGTVGGRLCWLRG